VTAFLRLLESTQIRSNALKGSRNGSRDFGLGLASETHFSDLLGVLSLQNDSSFSALGFSGVLESQRELQPELLIDQDHQVFWHKANAFDQPVDMRRPQCLNLGFAVVIQSGAV
jgi:hypothetical protein